jgi:hypothetical protein
MGKYDLEDQGEDGKTISKWISQKKNMRMSTGLIWLR